MILNGFDFNRPMQRRQMRGYGQPLPAPMPGRPMPMRPSIGPGDPRVAQLMQENAALKQRLAALGAVVNQLQQRLAQASQRIMPARERVVDVGQPAPRPMAGVAPGASDTMSQSATDRAWYGDLLRGSEPADFGGDSFDGLDADLGLE